ncbi:MAG: TolC family protein [Flavobacterium sp.]
MKQLVRKTTYSFVFITLIGISATLRGQNTPEQVMSLNEFLGYVKQYHPLVKQAQLDLNQAQAGVMAARGGFDPKIEVDYVNKRFNSIDYFEVLNGSFKIPTWYGIEVKAGFEQTEGVYINPDQTFPTSGLATLGITVPVGQGLFINQRMADLRQAKLFRNLGQAERDLEVARVLFEATLAYNDWYRDYREYALYQTFLTNAEVRFRGIKTLIEQGDRPGIDSIEARILVSSRKLNLEQSRIKFVKSKLQLSNFLWIDNVPVELQDNIIPESELETTIAETLKTNGLLFNDVDLANHPKIKALENKVGILRVEKKLKGDLLKPRIDLNYNYLSEPVLMNEWNMANYKYGVQFSFPLFLRKERGNFKMAKFKLQDAELDLDLESVVLKNKIDFQLQEITSLEEQLRLANQLVGDFTTMLQSEERLFFFGESSIFLINARENSLLGSNLQLISTQLRYCTAHAELYQLLANPELDD